MARDTYMEGKQKHSLMELVAPRLRLDLTSDRWMLGKGDCSIIRGLNVVRSGVVGPDPGRKPVQNNPHADYLQFGDISSAFGCDLVPRAPCRIQDYLWADSSLAVGHELYTFGATRRSLTIRDNGAAMATSAIQTWPDEVVGGYIIFHDDANNTKQGAVTGAQPVVRKIISVSNGITLVWDEPIAANDVGWAFEDNLVGLTQHQNFTVIYRKTIDRRGVIVTNGQHWKLIQGAAYTPLTFEPGNDPETGTALTAADYNGARWRFAPIAAHLVLAVNPDYFPRVFRIGDHLVQNSTQYHLRKAGLRAPVPDHADLRPDEGQHGPAVNDVFWIAQFKASVTTGRGMGATPEYATTVRIKVRLINLDDGVYSRFVDVYQAEDGSSPLWNVDSPRTRDITVPASQADGVIVIRPSEGGVSVTNRVLDQRATHLEIWRTTLDGPDFYLERRIVLRAGVDHASPAFAYDNSLPPYNGFLSCVAYLPDTQLIAQPIMDTAEFSYGFGPPCCRRVAYADGVTLCAGKAAADAPLDDEFVHRALRINDDEEVMYSRAFAPEVFSQRVLRLSSRGDVLRDVVAVDKQFAVIMDGGVHLLRRVGENLVAEEVAVSGEGTPWENSVVTVGNLVVWGTRDGIRKLTVASEPDASGRRGRTELVADAEVSEWFSEAFDNGEVIDAGIDHRNMCIRFRRAISANNYEVLQFNYGTGAMTLLEDPGILYANTTYADADPKQSPVCYSIGADGVLFEVNHEGLTHPYDSSTVQGILTADKYQVPTHGMSIVTISSGGELFSGAMTGDVIRFRSTNPLVNGQTRVIRAAAALGGVSSIDFDEVEGLTFGDEFIIGATLFRLRFAPEKGSYANTIKTVQDVSIRALPGPRNKAAGPGPYPPAGKLTVRVYEDYPDTAQREKLSEIPIFDRGNVQYRSADRASAIEAQGCAIELEVECLDARSDFRLESVFLHTREELDVVSDASTTG